MSIRGLAKALGLSPTRIAQLLRKGMPAEPEAARAWRLQYVPAPTGAKSNVIALHEAVSSETVSGTVSYDTVSDTGVEDLGATLARLRHVERATAQAFEELLRQGKVAEVAALRREHCAVIKSLFDAETKAIRIAETRGKLITVDKALAMITEALAEPILLLRQLPNLAPDEAGRQRLQAFVNGVLDAIKAGAHRGLERRAKSV
jgi:hypothetical protein